MKYLFIGNSHTYYNGMPHLFELLAQTVDADTHVTMLTRGGMGFPYHADGEEAPFNIRYGGYDYVILQHVAHPMGDIDEMFRAGRQLVALAKESGAVPLLYMTWAAEGDEAYQPTMSGAYRQLAQQTGALLIPVGEVWQAARKALPHVDLFYSDRRHASVAGSKLIAATAFAAIFDQLPPAQTPDEQVIAQLALEITRRENRRPDPRG